MTSEAGPLYTRGYSFLDAWATPYGQAVRACAAYQVLTLVDRPSVFSIIAVLGATLMLVGCYDGAVICILIIDAVL